MGHKLCTTSLKINTKEFSSVPIYKINQWYWRSVYRLHCSNSIEWFIWTIYSRHGSPEQLKHDQTSSSHYVPSIPEIHLLRPYIIHFYSCSIHWKSWPCSWSCYWLLGRSITILNRVQNTLLRVKNFNLSQLFIKWIQIKVLQFLLV